MQGVVQLITLLNLIKKNSYLTMAFKNIILFIFLNDIIFPLLTFLVVIIASINFSSKDDMGKKKTIGKKIVFIGIKGRILIIVAFIVLSFSIIKIIIAKDEEIKKDNRLSDMETTIKDTHITLKNNSEVISNSQKLNIKLHTKIEYLNNNIIKLKNAEIDYLKKEKLERIKRNLTLAVNEIDNNLRFILMINNDLLDSLMLDNKSLVDQISIKYLSILFENNFEPNQFAFLQSVLVDLQEVKKRLNNLSDPRIKSNFEKRSLIKKSEDLKKRLPMLKNMLLMDTEIEIQENLFIFH